MGAMLPERPHPLARAPLVDRTCAGLDHAWERGWLPPPSIDPDELWRRAAKGYAVETERGGRSEEDVADFRERLSALCSAVASEARLNALGKTMAHGQIVRVIRQRLGLGQLWLQRPELLDTPLAPPIVVVGPMRSGTTRLHRLLAADPAHCATRFCDSWSPVPQRIDMRPLWGGMMLAVARQLDPWIDALHPMGSMRAEEELGWITSALGHSTFETQWRVSSFTSFCEKRDATPIYREFARILRTDAAHHGNAMRPRVLKVPQFSEELPALLAQFPCARLVIANRDGEDVLRSAVSLVANQMTIQSDHVDLDWIEAEWRRKLDLSHALVEAALADFTGPVAHVHFDALGANWEAEIARIYAELGIDLAPEARTAMRAEMRESELSPHRFHAMQLARFKSGKAA
ncbi:sulfotransferase family protein [Altererythrobacter litoralis]|uniref:Sulfotransferase n=1 Tax=Altererythrobacter litoralis TaxID=3113904 RepID=A0ABU7GDI0_9SPHN|nr:sulfotransferase [Erythrobacteraceae bacterium 1XM1-14]